MKLERAEYGYTDNGGTGLGLKYALIVAAIVSDTESFNNCRRTSSLESHMSWVRNLSKKKVPFKNIYAAKGHLR